MSTRRHLSEPDEDRPRGPWRGPVCAGLALVGALGATVGTGSASAQVPGKLIECKAVAGASAFSPGITITSRTITAEGSAVLEDCQSDSQPTITHGIAKWSGIQGQVHCPSLAYPLTANSVSVTDANPITVTWLDAANDIVDTSTITGSGDFGNFTAVPTTGPVSLPPSMGKVSGMFAGGTITGLLTSVKFNGDCLTGGVTSATATGSGAIEG